MVYHVAMTPKTFLVESVYCRQNYLQRIPPCVVKSHNRVLVEISLPLTAGTRQRSNFYLIEGYPDAIIGTHCPSGSNG